MDMGGVKQDNVGVTKSFIGGILSMKFYEGGYGLAMFYQVIQGRGGLCHQDLAQLLLR